MINHPMFDGLYHLFMVIWGMVYCWFNHTLFHIPYVFLPYISYIYILYIYVWALYSQQPNNDLDVLLPWTQVPSAGAPSRAGEHGLR